MRLAPLTIGEPPAGLDRASWRRLAGGRSRPARRLDLHGLTAAQALAALEAFLAAASDAGERIVEVVTGRGSGAEGGVIRREFIHWLNRPSLRPLLLGASHPHPANPGAVLLLLRRRR
ncbi:MAG TPA: Smr/MutS family protein [Acetobacteraceae bacterium]|nr:Smr/MutS family protein [Acetobacteraceae bacterium]